MYNALRLGKDFCVGMCTCNLFTANVTLELYSKKKK